MNEGLGAFALVGGGLLLLEGWLYWRRRPFRQAHRRNDSRPWRNLR